MKTISIPQKPKPQFITVHPDLWKRLRKEQLQNTGFNFLGIPVYVDPKMNPGLILFTKRIENETSITDPPSLGLDRLHPVHSTRLLA